MRAPHHLNALRAFEAAARHQSFAAAADELNVTPAAIGQLVRGLEETLGIDLFHRSQAGPARLVLTDQARAAIPDLQAGFDLLSAALDRLKAGGSRTSITVTVPPAFADKWLLKRVERFQAQHPEVDLRIDTNGRLADFAAERIDLGIRYGGGRWAGLEATYLLTDAFFPVCSPNLLNSRHPLKSAADLRHYPLIHDLSMSFESSFPTWRSWLQWAGEVTIDCDRGLKVNDSAAVIQAAIAGNGVALGRTTLVAEDLAAGRLIRPFGEAQPYDFAYYVIHKKESGTAPAIVAFKQWLLSEATAG